MKKFAATVLAALFSASAFAATAYMDAVSKQVSWFRPDRAVDPVTEQEFANPSDGTLVACGFVLVEYEDCDFKYRLWGWEPSPWCRAMNAAERQAVDDAEAKAEAEAAAYASPQPVVLVPRVDGSLTNIVGESQIIVDAATGEVLAVDDTGSPKHTLAQKQAQFAANEAAKAKAKTAKAKGNGLPALAERVAALEALNGIE